MAQSREILTPDLGEVSLNSTVGGEITLKIF